MTDKVFLYLSKDGDSFKLKIFAPNFRNVGLGDDIHEILNDADSVNTLDGALFLLKKIKEDPKHAEWVTLMHSHNPKYPEHSLNVGPFGMFQKGQAHKDTIEKMIEFVEKRSEEIDQMNSCCTIV